MLDQYFKEGKVLGQRGMDALKKTFTDKLEFLRNQKSTNIEELKE
jgi:hypothetical protein